MKTQNYNPSKLETEFVEAITTLKNQIEDNLPNNQIVKIEQETEKDNPSLKFYLLDNDGDPHEMVIRIIQIPDKF